jgi:PiT family inorganic phosphate transporter
MFSPELILVLFLILGAEFVNGWHDAANSIATVVSTRVLSPFKAIILAGILNVFGVLSGTAVAATIGTGIIKPGAINLEILGAAMLSIIFWGHIYLVFWTTDEHKPRFSF